MSKNSKNTVAVKAKRPKAASISREAFYVAWMTAAKNDGTVGDVAEALGVSKQRVSAKATQFHANGVDLPSLKREKRAVSYEVFKARLAETTLARKSA